jgi:ribosomal protein S18 acetylase RimI-like enzyme
VNIRRATAEDEAALRALWEEFEAEVPEPEGFAAEQWEEAWRDLRADMEHAGVYLADEGGEPIGMLAASDAGAGRWHLEIVHVREAARRRGVATELVRACAADARAAGATYVSLEVLDSNRVARIAWQRLGFGEVEHLLGQPLEALETRLGVAATGPSRAAVHVQTDDRRSVEHGVADFFPRLSAPTLEPGPNGWIRIGDPVLDGDREAPGALAGELSDRLGTVALALGVEQGAVVRYRLYEHGRLVDEYLSVPSFYGPLSKVDELGYEANPTLVSRLTGAPFAQVRRVARIADSPDELPPAEELYAQIAEMMGVEP